MPNVEQGENTKSGNTEMAKSMEYKAVPEKQQGTYLNWHHFAFSCGDYVETFSAKSELLSWSVKEKEERDIWSRQRVARSGFLNMIFKLLAGTLSVLLRGFISKIQVYR